MEKNKNPDTANGGVFNKSYSNSQSKDKNFSYPPKKCKHLLNDLHLENHSTKALIELALDHLFILKDDYLQQALRLHEYYAKQRDCPPAKLKTLTERCEMLQEIIIYLMAVVERLQIYSVYTDKIEKAEKQAKEFWGEMPKEYALIFLHDIENPDINKKIITLIDKQ